MIAFLLTIIAGILLFAHFPKLAKNLLKYSLWILGAIITVAVLVLGYVIISENIDSEKLSHFGPVIGTVIGIIFLNGWNSWKTKQKTEPSIDEDIIIKQSENGDDGLFDLAMKPVDDFYAKAGLLAPKKSNKKDGFGGYSEYFIWMFKCGIWNLLLQDILGKEGLRITIKYQAQLLDKGLENGIISKSYVLMMDSFFEEVNKDNEEAALVNRILTYWYVRFTEEGELNDEEALKQINGSLREACVNNIEEIKNYWNSMFNKTELHASEVERWVRFATAQISPQES